MIVSPSTQISGNASPGHEGNIKQARAVHGFSHNPMSEHSQYDGQGFASASTVPSFILPLQLWTAKKRRMLMVWILTNTRLLKQMLT